MAEARAYAMRNRQGSDWFGHGGDGNAASNQQPVTPTKEVPVSPATKNGTDTSGSSRSKMIKPACNSNQWYKYDETSPASGAPPKKETPKAKTAPRQASGDWYAHGTPNSDAKKDTKPRVVTTEGESYCRRDKTGSSATWFTHDHSGDSAQQGAGPRVTSKEGCGNATRMRGESENWFSHEGNAAQAAPAHISKGRGIQPHSNEMHHIFHMDAAGK